MDYLDTSALVKLVFEEPESAALAGYLGDAPLVVSSLSRTELRRVAMRVGAGQLVCEELLRSCFHVVLSDAVLDAAGLVPPADLRSWDAIHVASAHVVRSQIRSFVAYDGRLLEAAEAAGFPIAHPE